MDWTSGQLMKTRTDWEPAARDVGGSLASVAYVGSAIGGPNCPAGADTGELFFAVFRSDFGASQFPVVRWERRGNVRDLEQVDITRRPKRSIHEGLAILRKMREESLAKDQDKLERDWLAKHRQQYAGQWIALLGDRLISHSTNPRDVFAAARAAGVRALVLRVEDSELRFAGW